jgi:hypothetical protein
MKIPNNAQSIVVDKKITDYLLNASHRIGKNKAGFFKRFGFDLSDIKAFKNSLIQHSIEREIEETENTEYGNKYKLKCELQTPDERNPCIVTVWIIETGKHRPTLITAYPAN